MFEKRVTLFRLLGFEVRADPSWLILAILVAWTLAGGFFPSRAPGLGGEAYWLLGALGALGLFASIVFHEFCHSLVARRLGIPMKGITLFIFGGVAEMSEEPKSPKAEFLMAAAGPLSSALLALLFFAAGRIGDRLGLPPPGEALLSYLSFLNGMLAAFNLLPGFPLDGGRVLRSAIWAWTGNLRRATRIASMTGSVFGTLLYALGILEVLRNNVLGGLWWFLIGMFLGNASRLSYRQLLARTAFDGEPVRRFMKEDPVTVPPTISIASLVEEYIYHHHYRMYPVVRDGLLVGCVGTAEVRRVPREDWAKTRVGDIASRCACGNTIGPGDDAMKAMALMSREGSSRLLVAEGGRLLGIVTLKDMLKLLAIKLDLEGGD